MQADKTIVVHERPDAQPIVLYVVRKGEANPAVHHVNAKPSVWFVTTPVHDGTQRSTTVHD